MKNFAELFTERVKENPNKIFVRDANEECSYIQMYERALTASGFIKEYDGEIICILMKKSIDAVAVLLGTFFASKAYVFINPTAPVERIKSMLKVAGSKVLLVDAVFEKEVLEEKLGVDIFRINLDGKGTINSNVSYQLPSISDGGLLYGMFTSGTTGEPKLVVANHKSVMGFISQFVDEIGLSSDCIIGNQAPYDFDVSVKDIFSTIYCGGTMVIIDKEMLTRPDDLLEYLKDKGVNTLIWAVTALCLAAGATDFDKNISKNITKICFSGEIMPMKFLRKWKNALPDCDFYNVYGPTEVICNCTWYKVANEDLDKNRIPIGKAFNNRRVFLLDEKGSEIDLTCTEGEICVSGDLSDGYFHNDVETKKRFMSHKINEREEILYHTGDIAYLSEDGQLIFVGRKDFQIKRMGHRIELEEIDSRVSTMSGVEMACSIYDFETQKLCLFYTGIANSSEIRKELRRQIPVYMLPNRIIQIDTMPLNKNGKTDRNRIKKEHEEFFK